MSVSGKYIYTLALYNIQLMYSTITKIIQIKIKIQVKY